MGLASIDPSGHCFMASRTHARTHAPRVLREAEVAADDVLEQPHGGHLDERLHHVAQHRAHLCMTTGRVCDDNGEVSASGVNRHLT